MPDEPYKLWITYEVLTGDEDAEPDQRRELFEFPASYVEKTVIAGTVTTMGPSIGQMLKAIRERTSGQEAEIIRTEPAG